MSYTRKINIEDLCPTAPALLLLALGNACVLRRCPKSQATVT